MHWQASYEKYCSNVFRHLSFIHRYIHLQLNDKLELGGYIGVKTSFIQVIPYIGKNGGRLTDIAQRHQQSKGSLAKLIHEIHQQGYITKQQDADDCRSKKLFVTQRGINLITDAMAISRQITHELATLLGTETFQSWIQCIEAVFHAMQLSYPAGRQYTEFSADARAGARLQIQLNEITQAMETQLLTTNKQRGYDDLQKSFAPILSHIDDKGVRVSNLAEATGLSKQNVSDISQKLVRRGYLERLADPDDRRAQRLLFSRRGKAMISASMQTMIDVEIQLGDLMGRELFAELQTISKRLYHLLNGSGPTTSPDITTRDIFTDLTPWLEDMQLALLQHLQSEQPQHLADVFVKDGNQRLQFTPAFLQYLQTLTVKAKP